MNKTELTEKVARKSGISKTDASKAVEAFMDSITESLNSNDKVTLPGFGVFSTHEQAARIGRNPSTGESVDIPARRVAKFKAGTGLKDTLNS